MRCKFEVHRLVALPIEDYSELEERLEEADLEGRTVLTTFESYCSFEDDFGHRYQGQYLFGIFQGQGKRRDRGRLRG